MAGLGGLLSSDVMGLGMSVGNDIFQQLGNAGANLGNFYQYGRGEEQLWDLGRRQQGSANALGNYYSGMYGGMGDEFARQYQQFAPGLIDDYTGMSRDLQRRYGAERNQSLVDMQGNMNDVNAGYADRYSRGMQYLQGQGDQDRKDLARSYGDMRAKTAADLSERGLGGTTVIPSLMAGNKRTESDALARLNEGYNRQYMAADAGLSGDALSARERMGDNYARFRFGTGQDELGFAKGLDAGGIAMRQGLGQYGIEGDMANRYRALQNRYAMDRLPMDTDYQNTMNMVQHFDRLQFNPPPPNQGMMQAAGAMMAPEPQQPETDWYTPLIGGASNVGAGFASGWGAQAARGATSYVPNMGYGFY